MSYCIASDIGNDRGIDTVQAVATVLEFILGEDAFYRIGHTWEVPAHPIVRIGADYVKNVNRRLHEITEVSLYRYSTDTPVVTSTLETIITAGRPYMKLGSSIASSLLTDGDRFVITADIGMGLPQAAATADSTTEYDIGTTIIRSGATLLVSEDGVTVQLGDRVIKPPALLNRAAISVGRRIAYLENDVAARFDDSSNLASPSTLLDGWEKELRRYAGRL